MFNLQKIFIWRSFRFRVGKFSEFHKLKKIWKTLNIRFQNYQSQGQKSISSTLPVPCTSGLMHFRWNHKVDPWKFIYKRCRFPCWKSNINCWYFSRIVSNTHFWLVYQWEVILETILSLQFIATSSFIKLWLFKISKNWEILYQDENRSGISKNWQQVRIRFINENLEFFLFDRPSVSAELW